MAQADIAVTTSSAAGIDGPQDNFILAETPMGGDELERQISESEHRPVVVVHHDPSAARRIIPKAVTGGAVVEAATAFEEARAAEDPESATVPLRWLRANIHRSVIPVLGEVQCHRDVTRALAAAMAHLEDRGLAALIDPEASTVCFDRRSDPAKGDHWMHNYGLAIDLNVGEEPDDPTSIDRRLRRIMGRFGFAWGGDFLEPSPTHFEYAGPYEIGSPPPVD